MGNALGPSYANAFLCYHELNWLNDCPELFTCLLPSFGDTFLIFKDPTYGQPFLAYLNSRHPNIKFTCETEQNHTLSFLDSTITNNNGTLSTGVYRKST